MAIKAAATARTAMARDTADAILGHRADVVASLRPYSEFSWKKLEFFCF
jgi:hypothetical protein